MSQAVALTAQERTTTGKHNKALRRAGWVPARIADSQCGAQLVQVEAKALTDVLRRVGQTGVIKLRVGPGRAASVMIQGVERHPVTLAILHVDFHLVDLSEPITVQVPVVLTGEAPAVRDHDALISQQVNSLPVTALPDHMPSEVMVDVSSLTEPGQMIHLRDLNLHSGEVTIHADEDMVIAVANQAQKIEEPVAEAASETTGEQAEPSPKGEAQEQSGEG